MVLTSTQLQKRGHTLASMCPVCGKAKETIEHLCIHCPMIWRSCTALFSASLTGWTCPFLVHDVIIGWTCPPPLSKKDVKVWRATPFCLLWEIWRERNKVVFEDGTFLLRLKSSFLRSSSFGLVLPLSLMILMLGYFFAQSFLYLRAGKFLFSCPFCFLVCGSYVYAILALFGLLLIYLSLL